MSFQGKENYTLLFVHVLSNFIVTRTHLRCIFPHPRDVDWYHPLPITPPGLSSSRRIRRALRQQCLARPGWHLVQYSFSNRPNRKQKLLTISTTPVDVVQVTVQTTTLRQAHRESIRITTTHLGPPLQNFRLVTVRETHISTR